jgi:hypothetical protein
MDPRHLQNVICLADFAVEAARLKEDAHVPASLDSSGAPRRSDDDTPQAEQVVRDSVQQ